MEWKCFYYLQRPDGQPADYCADRSLAPTGTSQLNRLSEREREVFTAEELSIGLETERDEHFNFEL